MDLGATTPGPDADVDGVGVTMHYLDLYTNPFSTHFFRLFFSPNSYGMGLLSPRGDIHCTPYRSTCVPGGRSEHDLGSPFFRGVSVGLVWVL